MTLMTRFIKSVFYGIFVLLSFACFAQQEMNPVLLKFPGIFNNPAGMINGRKNTFNYPAANGTAYFMKSGQANPELVTITGTYDSILLKYDLLNDMLLLGYEDNAGMEEIQLNKDIVSGFTLFGSVFVHLNEPGILPEGYYEQLYNGRIRLFKKYIKTLSAKSGAVQYEYRENIQKILIRENHAYKVTNKSSLLKALIDKQKEVNNYLKENHIMVNHATDAELIRVIKYYESLLP